MEWSNPLAEAQWALPQRQGICSVFARIVPRVALRQGNHEGDPGQLLPPNQKQRASFLVSLGGGAGAGAAQKPGRS
jgi:hypothetical protein